MSNSEHRNWSITLTPHRSLSRQGFTAVMVLIAVLNLVAGSVFFAIGAWPVVGFCGLDVLIMYWAFRRNFSDSACAERIVAEGDALRLQRMARDCAPEEITFNRRWVKVVLEEDTHRELIGKLFLRSHGEAHEIASFLGADERLSLARALRSAI
jgi:uncharacterized membrane protein